MNGKVKVGVIGVGSLGQHHARILSQMSSCQLEGIYDLNPQRALEVARLFKTQAFTSLDELIGKIDAATVVVPTDKHYETFLKLSENNIHMLVEKPIASTSAEAEEMVHIAEKKHIILQVGHVERFNPVMNFLESRLTEPRFMEVTRMAPYPPQRPEGVPRGTEVSVVLDLMIHDLEIILHVLNSKVKEIHAVGVPVLSSTEDIANVRLVFENGCVANVTASRISPERMRKIRVFQSDTYVSLDYMNQSGQICRILGGQVTSEPVPIEKGEPLAEEIKSFIECVATQSEPVVSGRHASDALQLAVAICERMRSHPS